jgi:predicted HAD superfamily hydrolase
MHPVETAPLPEGPQDPGRDARSDPGTDSLFSTSDLVSFDVFDTLISRTVLKPIDVFSLVKLSLLEHPLALSCSDVVDAFPALRVRAEALARKASLEAGGTSEVTLAGIYRTLAAVSGADPECISLLQATELDFELRVVYPLPTGRQLWDTARSEAKRIVLCSDMYLPSDFIASLLRKCGYDGYEALYVSCEHQRSKGEGSLFSYIAEKHGVLPSRILHIGDNEHADFRMAKEAGCQALHLPKPAVAWLPEMPLELEKPFYLRTVASSFYGLLHATGSSEAQADPWHKVGYQVFGPLFTGFMFWLAAMVQRNRPDKVFLLARDAHFIHAHLGSVLKPLGLDPELAYLYVSRSALLLPSFTDFPLPRLWHLFSGRSPKPISHHLKRLGLSPDLLGPLAESVGFSSVEDVVENGNPQMFALLSKLYQPLLQVSARQRPLVRRYLEGFVGDARRLMLVDIGWVGNMQASFMRVLEPFLTDLDVRGYYVGLHRSASDNFYPGSTMQGWLTHYGVPGPIETDVWWKGGVELLEFAMCAPHGTTLGYRIAENGQVEPVLEDHGVDAESQELSARLQRGASAFLRDYLEIYARIPGAALNTGVWANEFCRLVVHPTREEAELLGDVTHSDAFGDTTTRLGLAPRIDDQDDLPAAFERCFWKAGFRVRNQMETRP